MVKDKNSRIAKNRNDSKFINVLFVGDICGRPGRQMFAKQIKRLRGKYDIDIVMSNVENAAHGRGVTEKIVKELLDYGVDFMTAGNHIWRCKDFREVLSGRYPVIRGINYPDDLPGKGWGVVDLGSKGKVLIIQLIGWGYMNERTITEPFRKISEFLKEIDIDEYSATIIDFHAEATAEKVGLGLFLDGQVSAVIGTHTHIPTADERVLPNGTAYITDVGSVSPLDSVLWVKKEIIFQQNMYPYSSRYDIQEEGDVRFDSVFMKFDIDTHKACGIRRLNFIK